MNSVVLPERTDTACVTNDGTPGEEAPFLQAPAMKTELIYQKLGEIFPTLKPFLESGKKKKHQYPGREKRKTPIFAPEPPKDAKPDLTEFYVKFPPKFQESGPYRLAELKTLARDGLITAETHIRTEKSSWIYAKNIKGLVSVQPEDE